MNKIQIARHLLKDQMINGNLWPGTRCACGEYGATDLGHIVYTRHPDSVELYHAYNCCMLHNVCNTTDEALWKNLNACLIILDRARGPKNWTEWAMGIPRKSPMWIPQKMVTATEMWGHGIRAFQFTDIMDYINRPLGGDDE